MRLCRRSCRCDLTEQQTHTHTSTVLANSDQIRSDQRQPHQIKSVLSVWMCGTATARQRRVLRKLHNRAAPHSRHSNKRCQKYHRFFFTCRRLSPRPLSSKVSRKGEHLFGEQVVGPVALRPQQLEACKTPGSATDADNTEGSVRWHG